MSISLGISIIVLAIQITNSSIGEGIESSQLITVEVLLEYKVESRRKLIKKSVKSQVEEEDVNGTDVRR